MSQVNGEKNSAVPTDETDDVLSALQAAQLFIKAGQGNVDASKAYSLLSIAENFDRLLQEMDATKCGHGVVTLFQECNSCRTARGV